MVSHKDYSAELSEAYPDRGHPIADPQPGFIPGTTTFLPQVGLGDVGYIQQSNGRFVRLFNVHKAPGHDGQPNPDRLPVGFEVLDHDSIRVEEGQIDKSLFKSRSVTQISVDAGGSGQSLIPLQGAFSFKTARQRGAILVTPGPARIITTDASPRGVKTYKEYAAKHMINWLNFFEEEGLERGDLILVTGVDLTASWATAVFTSANLETSLGLDVEYATVGGIRAAAKLSWSHDQAAMTNATPLPREGPNTQANQAIFIRRLRAKRGLLGLALRANAEPRDIQRYNHSDTAGDQGIKVEGECEPYVKIEEGIEPSLKTEDEIKTGVKAEDDIGSSMKMEDFGNVDPDVEMEEVSQREEFVDSLTPALDYILENSNAHVALVHDLDVPVFNRLTTHPQTKSSSIVITENGIGMLSSPSTPATEPTGTAPPDSLSSFMIVAPSLLHVAPTVTVNPSSRKRSRRGMTPADAEGSCSESDDSSGTSHDRPRLSRQTSPVVEEPPPRLPGACTYCKRLKIKCDFPSGANICRRCRAGNHHCVVEGRKARSTPTKREHLLAQLRQKDVIIENLLKQLHNSNSAAAPASAVSHMASIHDANHRGQNIPSEFSAGAVHHGFSTVHAQELSMDSRMRKVDLVYDTVDDVVVGSRDDIEIVERGGSITLPTAPMDVVTQVTASSSYSDATTPARNYLRAPTQDKEDGVDEEEEPKVDNARSMSTAKHHYASPAPKLISSRQQRVVDKMAPPDILLNGLISFEDVEKLFQIFFMRLNPFIGMFDLLLHTPSSVLSRCPPLFSLICAITLRYSQRADLYPLAMNLAKNAVGQALRDGCKSVELCQAYLLMSMYDTPTHRLDQDNSCMYTAIAIRIAMDLNLHDYNSYQGKSGVEAREVINRTRVWMMCYNLDQSTATQFGKPSTLKEDRIIREGPGWYNHSPANDPFDIHLVAYSSLMRVLSRFQAEICNDPYFAMGSDRAVDFRPIALRYDQELQRAYEEWVGLFQRDSDHNNPAAEYRCKMLPFYVNYSRLVVLSFAFEQAFERGFERSDEVIFTKSITAAQIVVTELVNSLAPSGYLRYAPDSHFVFGLFASAFMLNLLRPECRIFHGQGFDENIYGTIERLVYTFGTSAVTVDEHHTPHLYSDILGRLLAKHRRDTANATRAAARRLLPGSGPQRRTRNQNQHQDGGATASSSSARASGQGQVDQMRHGGVQAQQRPSVKDPSAEHPTPGSIYSGDAGQAQQQHAYQQQYTTAFATAGSQQHRQLNPKKAMYRCPPTSPGAAYPTPASQHASPDPVPQMGAELNFAFEGGLPIMGDDTPALMKASSQSAFWDTFMMPGWSWPFDDPMDTAQQQQVPTDADPAGAVEVNADIQAIPT